MPLEEPAFDDGIVRCLELRRVGRFGPELQTSLFELVERTRDSTSKASTTFLGSSLEVRIHAKSIAQALRRTTPSVRRQRRLEMPAFRL
jgi:hypothetical protein